MVTAARLFLLAVGAGVPVVMHSVRLPPGSDDLRLLFRCVAALWVFVCVRLSLEGGDQ